jgi:hypothetical protein
MGRPAQSAWIIRIFALVLAAASAAPAIAAVTANGVALGASAGCSNGRIDITLTNNGADRESWRATNVAGTTLAQGEGPTGFPSGTSNGFFPQVFLPSQPADTLIGSYAYVGETPPDATNTAEFFVFYNCSTRQVIRSCFGPYGTCPQTAQQAAQSLVPTQVPTLGGAALALMSLLIAGLGWRARSRRS